MPRNFYRRVEIAFPVEAPALRDEIIQEVLPAFSRDHGKARELQADGTYVRLKAGRWRATRRRRSCNSASIRGGRRKSSRRNTARENAALADQESAAQARMRWQPAAAGFRGAAG